MTTIDLTAAPVGWRVLVESGASSAAWARVDAVDEQRPHLCKVIYEHSGTAAWIARKRIRASYRPRARASEAALERRLEHAQDGREDAQREQAANEAEERGATC
jgi:hypothetical protein